jgi:hypothetical protein
MPIPDYIINPDGSLREFTDAEVEEMGLDTRGIRDGASPRRQGDQTQETVNHRCFVNQDYLDAAMAYMLGATKEYISPLDGNLHLSRNMPAPYPLWDWLRGSALTSSTGHKFESDFGVGSGYKFNRPVYLKDETEWTFQTMPFNLATDAEVTAADNYEGIRYVQTLPTQQFSEYLTFPGLGLKYTKNGGGGPQGREVGFNNGFPILASIISKKWYRIPKQCWGRDSNLYTKLFGDPDSQVTGLVGTINKYPIFGFPAGTMLLLTPEEEIVFDQASSEYCYNIIYKWKFNPFGHNHLLFFDRGPTTFTGFYPVSNDAVYYTTATLPDGKSIFNARDHDGENQGVYTGVFSVGVDP